MGAFIQARAQLVRGFANQLFRKNAESKSAPMAGSTDYVAESLVNWVVSNAKEQKLRCGCLYCVGHEAGQQTLSNAICFGIYPILLMDKHERPIPDDINTKQSPHFVYGIVSSTTFSDTVSDSNVEIVIAIQLHVNQFQCISKGHGFKSCPKLMQVP